MAKILIVDDSSFQRRCVKAALGAEAHEYLEAASGHEALERLESEQVDLMCLDLNMPVMGGIECLEAMRSREMTVPTIVCTADIQATTKQKCLELGAIDVINKPVEQDQMKALLSKVFSG